MFLLVELVWQVGYAPERRHSNDCLRHHLCLFNNIRNWDRDFSFHVNPLTNKSTPHAYLCRVLLFLSDLEHLHQFHCQVQVTCQLDLPLHEGLHPVEFACEDLDII
jgi:hypothetical protein